MATTLVSAHGLPLYKILGLTGVSVLSGAWFYRIETHTAYPIFNPSLLSIRMFMLPVFSAVIVFIALFTMVFLMPFYLVHPRGLSIDRAGFMMVIPFVL